MKYLIFVTFLITLVGCSKREQDPVFDWGYLPSIQKSYWENSKLCSHKAYSMGFYLGADIESNLHIKGKRISGRSHQMLLGDTCLDVSVSTRVYLDPELQDKNYYSVSVNVPVKDDRCTSSKLPLACKDSSVAYEIIFQREIEQNIIGNYFKGKTIEEIVEYNLLDNSVKFVLPSETIEYQLPSL